MTSSISSKVQGIWPLLCLPKHKAGETTQGRTCAQHVGLPGPQTLTYLPSPLGYCGENHKPRCGRATHPRAPGHPGLHPLCIWWASHRNARGILNIHCPPKDYLTQPRPATTLSVSSGSSVTPPQESNSRECPVWGKGFISLTASCLLYCQGDHYPHWSGAEQSQDQAPPL